MTGAAAPRAGATRGVGVAAPAADRRPAAGHLVWRWYLPLLAGLLPVLVIGLVASGLANRLAFAGWAIAVGVAYASLLRVTYDLGWAGRFVAAAGLATLALGFGAFAALAERHGEILDLGYRAVLPALHHPMLTRPGTWLGLAAALAVAAVARLSVGGGKPVGDRKSAPQPMKDVPS